MTIILKCNLCKDEKINLEEEKVHNMKDLKEKTGWSHHPGQVHICLGCNSKHDKHRTLISDGEDSAIMERANSMMYSEPGKPKPQIDIIGLDGKLENGLVKSYECRYCEYYANSRLDENDKDIGDLNVYKHETRKHPRTFVGLRKLPKGWKRPIMMRPKRERWGRSK